MSQLQTFRSIQDAEAYLEFFEIDYDERLVHVKRFHIMKKFGEMIAKGEASLNDDHALLDFYRFALITVYKNFENGYNPSAAEVWSSFNTQSPCGSCSTSTGCSTVEEVSNGVHACASQLHLGLN